jgi:Flp pilus assembly protein TadD
MSRNPARLVLTLVAASALTASAAPAFAWPFGVGKPAAPAAKPDPNAPRKATPEERAAAARLDPLVRAAFWQRELSVDPSDVEAGVGLAAALRALGKFDEASDAADRAVMIAPKNEEALLESARDHIAAGHGFYGVQPLKDAELLAPKDWRPVSLMGVALEQTERPEEALAAYNQALKLSPNNPAVLSNLAMFYAARGDKAQAEALLRAAAAQPTATAQERQNLALILGLEGKLAEAEHLMRQDLPPEAVDANLAYLKAGTAPTAAAPQPGAPPSAEAPAKASARTWGSVQLSDSKGG